MVYTSLPLTTTLLFFGSSSLPLELLCLIEKHCTTDVLWVLRLTSKFFCEISSGRLFRTLRTTNTAASADALCGLQHSSVARYVKELFFVYEDRIEYQGDVTSPHVEEDLRKVIFEAWSGLNKFTCLSTLGLVFHPRYEEMEEWDEGCFSYHFRLQKAVLSGLLQSKPTLSALTLSNVVAVDDPIYSSEGFVRLLSTVTSLSVDVISSDEEGSYYQDRLRHFWERFTAQFLAPATQTLETLSISSNYLVGDLPCLDLGIHFPRLAFVRLRHVIFTDDSPGTAESFLCLHAKTLKRFIMDECPLVIGTEGGPPRLWCDVWDHLTQTMEVLEEIVVWRCDGRDPPNVVLEQTGRKMGYVTLDVGYGFTAAMDEDVIGEENDDPALERLRVSLDARVRRCEKSV